MVTAVKRHKPVWGSDNVLCSEDREAERGRRKKGYLCIWPKRNCSISQKLECVDGLPVGEGSTSFWGLALAKSLLDKGKVLQESGGKPVWKQVLPVVHGNKLRTGKEPNFQTLIFVYVQIWFMSKSDLCFFQTILLISQ